MSAPVHIAVTRRVRKTHVADFERALADFAHHSMGEAGACGVHCLHPAPGADPAEYGILRTFAGPAERDAFYQSKLYQDWLTQIEPMVEGEATYRELNGLEAWFRDSYSAPPPRWKMAVLTWIAVWPVSMLVPAVLVPLIGGSLPAVLTAGIVAGGIVLVLTWIAMPLLVRIAHRWIQPPTPALKKL
jgi:antibiotic biosynthesis monooxygenase (ABM) superfamily enzyme